MRLTDIGYAQVQKFVNELLTEVSSKTVHNPLILLRVMRTGKKGVSASSGAFCAATQPKAWN